MVVQHAGLRAPRNGAATQVRDAETMKRKNVTNDASAPASRGKVPTIASKMTKSEMTNSDPGDIQSINSCDSDIAFEDDGFIDDAEDDDDETDVDMTALDEDGPDRNDPNAGVDGHQNTHSHPHSVSAASSGLQQRDRKSKADLTQPQLSHANETPPMAGFPVTETPNCFSSENDWSRMHLSRPLLKALADLGFERPTVIQRQAIPVAMQGQDILGTAQTGSGKTAAFLLPILERLCRSAAVRTRRISSTGYIGGSAVTKALILLPTRELAVQCFEMLQALSKYTPVTQLLVTGGLSQRAQESSFRRQPDIVVATPGRVLDMLLNSSSIHIELLEIVVLDEADRLLEMGFKEECLRILSHCSRGRQTLLFSATLSDAIRDLALLSLKRPLRINASTSHTVPTTLEQILVPVPKLQSDAYPDAPPTAREAILLHLCFETFKGKRIIVFFRTKRSAHRAALIFRLLGIPHAELHGNLPQSKRLEALQTFHTLSTDSSTVRFLLCSELAARGLDIPYVDVVVNFYVPPEASRYVHQVGRTARIGKQGTAVTLFSHDEKLQVKRVIRRACGGNNVAVSKVTKRTVAPASWKHWEEKIQQLESSISDILEQERLERELRLAEIEVQRAENIQVYQDEILSRPKRRWIPRPVTSALAAPTEVTAEEEERLLAQIQAEKPSPKSDDEDDEDITYSNTDWSRQLDDDDDTVSIQSGLSSHASDHEDTNLQDENHSTSYLTIDEALKGPPGKLKKPKKSQRPPESKTIPPTTPLIRRTTPTTSKKSKAQLRAIAKTASLQQANNRMTPKQRSVLQNQRRSKQIGHYVKKASRLQRMRVTDDNYDDEALRKKRRPFHSNKITKKRA